MLERGPLNSTRDSAAPLPRQLGLGTATGVVVANMIGTGIFTITGLMLAQTGSGWLVMMAWLLGGLVAMCGALSYAELATMMPHAGGEYVYLREIYGPLPAFLTGWTSFFVGFSAPVAASAVGCAKYLTAAGLLPETWLAEKSTAAAIVLALTAVHYCGLRFGARVQNLLTGLKVFLLFGLIATGFSIGRETGISSPPPAAFGMQDAQRNWASLCCWPCLPTAAGTPPVTSRGKLSSPHAICRVRCCWARSSSRSFIC